MKPLFLALPASLALIFPALADDFAEAKKHFRSTFSQYCYLEDERDDDFFAPKYWDLSWKFDYSDTEYTAKLIQFFCSMGAYNVTHVYYMVDDNYGAMPVPFSVPYFDVTYENDDFEGAVLDITILGYNTQWSLTNSDFNPETASISNASYWRGIGDASSGGVWRFEQGQFILKSYDIDASYDGEINPERVVEFE